LILLPIDESLEPRPIALPKQVLSKTTVPVSRTDLDAAEIRLNRHETVDSHDLQLTWLSPFYYCGLELIDLLAYLPTMGFNLSQDRISTLTGLVKLDVLKS